MKKLVTTKFFLLLKEASQKGNAVDTHVLENCYEEFVMLLFSLSAALTSKAAFHNTLDYTRVELTSFTEEVSKKKHTGLFEKGY
jgi:hypothetical protein